MGNAVPSSYRIRFTDSERLVDAMRGANLEPCQLSQSPHPSQISHIALPSLSLGVAEMGPAMLFTGVTPPGCYTLVFVLACPSVGHSFNFSIRHTDGYLAFFPPGAALDVQTPEGNVDAILTISARRFLEAVDRLCPGLPDSVLQKGGGFRIPIDEQAELRLLLACVESIPLGPEAPLDHPNASQSLEDELLTAFLRVLRAGIGNEVSFTNAKLTNKAKRFGQIREFIDSSLGFPPPIEEVCQHAQLSVRSVENLFREFVGIGPHLYLRHRRLHNARTALLQLESLQVGSIKRVALDNGFWHLGRFSSYYKTLFGELPRETGEEF